MIISEGFWVYRPFDDELAAHPLAIQQVLQIVEMTDIDDGIVWLTGVAHAYTVKEVLEHGRLLRKVRMY